MKRPPLTPKQSELYDLMSEISEDCWCAGWLFGNEGSIWTAIVTGDRRYGMGEMAQADGERCKALADELGGWIVWRDDTTDDGMPVEDWGPYFLPMAEWLARYERWGT